VRVLNTREDPAKYTKVGPEIPSLFVGRRVSFKIFQCVPLPQIALPSYAETCMRRTTQATQPR
jgi:hypothetical protein